MSLNKIIVGDYGQTIQFTVIDVDTDAAADVSAYTTSQDVQFKDPDGNIATETAGFNGDGSDGLVDYTLADGDIDEGGRWRVRVRLKSGSAQLTTEWLEFEPEE